MRFFLFKSILQTQLGKFILSYFCPMVYSAESTFTHPFNYSSCYKQRLERGTGTWDLTEINGHRDKRSSKLSKLSSLNNKTAQTK